MKGNIMSEYETNNGIPQSVNELEETVVTLNSKVQELQESLEYSKERYTAFSDRHDEHIRNWRTRLNAMEVKANRRLEFLQKALNDAYGDQDKFDHTHPDVQRLILGALRVAKLRGLLSDGNAIADAFDASEVWGQVRNDDDFSGTGLESNTIRERQMAEVSRTMSDISHHPADPRFSEVWERATRLAQQHDLCSEYDGIAREFDIPTDHEFDYEGYVTVRFSGYASIPVDGRATRLAIQDGDVAYGSIDTSDILENVDHYNIDWEIDETDISVS
jgi:chaperonin cofactor prefoldin